MKKRSLLALTLFLYIPLVTAGEVGLSSSGQSISIDLWFDGVQEKKLQYYSRIILDSETYQNGTIVTVCGDGAISGSLGSGTCSGHSGANHTRQANFNRLGFVFGPAYWVSETIQVQGGIILSSYSSDVNIGDTSKYNFSNSGVEVGVSYMLPINEDIKLSFFYESEKKMSFIGLSLPSPF